MTVVLMLYSGAWYSQISRLKSKLTGKYFSTREKSKNPMTIQATSVRTDMTTMKGTK